MTAKIKQSTIAPNLQDGISVLVSEPATNVTVTDNLLAVRRCRVRLTNFSIAVLQANDYGGAKILDLPFRNMLLLGMEVDCVVTKQGNTNGIVAGTTINMAVGSAAAAATPLATTAIDTIEAVAISTNALVVDFERHSNDQSTATFPRRIADSASAALFMNISATITADSSVSVTGTVDIFYVDLGKLA
jgi:hypothetical protein